METKEIELSNGKKYVAKEIKYKDLIANSTEDKNESAKIILKLSTEISDEEFDNLSMRDGIKLQKAVSELNGLNDNFL